MIIKIYSVDQDPKHFEVDFNYMSRGLWNLSTETGEGREVNEGHFQNYLYNCLAKYYETM